MKKLTAIILTAVFAVTAFCFGVSAEEESKGVAILHTNDVHCGVYGDDSTLGAADLAAYKARLEDEGYEVILADAGDFVQGGIIGTLSEGKYPLEIMNKLGYDVAVPGNHEFDFGMDNFFMLAENADFSYLSANFTDLETGEKPFDGYKIIETSTAKIGFVGITTPETPKSSRPSNFQNEEGKLIYGFCGDDDGSLLYSAVQEAVDGALSDGADYIVLLGHMGDYVYREKWSSKAVIKNVSGIDVFIDGHSHSVIENEKVTDKDGKEVILASTGTKFQNIGVVTFDENGAVSKLINKDGFTLTTDENSAEYKAYKEMSDFISEIDEKNSEIIGTVVAKTDVELAVNDPETGERAVRNAETNLCDLCADAYRIKTGADIGFINGGGVRSSIDVGDITYGNIIDVQPFGNSLCVAEVSGQQILDSLEMGAAYYPEENGSFTQVSGLTYEIHSYIPSSVKKDEDGNFVSVEGEYRVKNVLVGGEPLDLSKTYTLASHNYMLLSCGDGMSMFKNCNIIAMEIMLDNQALIEYISENLGGTVGEEYSDPRGSGRITVVAEAPAETETAEENEASASDYEEEKAPATGGASSAEIIAIMAVFAALVLAVCKK
ncbi:MAG: bifunctional metallophosphatase/5'-nucleotidase [Ruminiclostridium sp.]